jgi:hypothetical protein
MKKYFLMGLVIGLGALAGVVIAASLPTKNPSTNTDAEGVMLYALNATSNTIVPLTVDANGALLVNTTL